MRFQKDDVAVVTGGGSGIGEATCYRFAQEGVAVVVVDRYYDAAARVARTIREQGGQAVPFQADVGDEPQALAIGRFAAEQFGRLTILVNNAGVRVYGPITEATVQDWDTILAVNLRGVGYCCKGAIPEMEKAGRGAIVNVSSANALVGRASMPLYDATKAGVLALTRALAVAHGPAIRVNAVCPGGTITPYHIRRAQERGLSEEEFRRQAHAGARNILRRQAEPEEIASAIVFLASEDASFITGETLMVDGGMYAI
ncbi:MAG: short-chain dehydrogenase [Candidatus Poribacteria bacterium]|nr:MAG: short-chain dehydrogenase [Candidatus Poribacteria bacterium]